MTAVNLQESRKRNKKQWPRPATGNEVQRENPNGDTSKEMRYPRLTNTFSQKKKRKETNKKIDKLAQKKDTEYTQYIKRKRSE